MKKKIDPFPFVCTALITLMAATCLVPILHVLAVSLSSNTAASAGVVWLWPKGFTLTSYAYVLKRVMFWKSMWVSIERVVLGGAINVLMCVLTAYPLSKSRERFSMRTPYVWFLFFTTLFSGGLIPWYILIKEFGMLDTIWALVLPGAVPVFNVLVMLNFYRAIPQQLEEAALIDGAGQWKILMRIYLPASLPAIATIMVFSLVNHWNNWFDGVILMNRPENYPMSSYLRILLFQSDILEVSSSSSQELKEISERTLQSAQMFVGILPILFVYPFLQKYFVKGILLGSVKG